jgi:hypothetical protein
VIIISSARPGWPSGVANITEWPSRLSTLQLTAASVGSKSLLGIGTMTFATLISGGEQSCVALRGP